MRRYENQPSPPSSEAASDRQVLRKLFPYLWRYRWRVLMALSCMIAAKFANVGVPLLLKQIVDHFSPSATQAALVVPMGLLLAYGALRLSNSVLTELRELVFAKATQGAARSIALETFAHLHALSLRFHLSRQTGGMTRDIERGVRGIESLISFSLYSIIPTLVEVALVLGILAVGYDVVFALIALLALGSYIAFTVSVTEWRTHHRRTANALDSSANAQAIDALLNYETVKYFGNEAYETRRYDKSLAQLQDAKLKAQRSLALLNMGQQLIIAVALIAMLWRATQGVVDGRLSLGDLVMINAFMIQLYMPLNFLGVIYREIKQSMTDLDRMFGLMAREREVQDLPGAPDLQLSGAPEVRLAHVHFAYESDRPILRDVSIHIPAGQTVAVVGPSGSGKSTLARLLFRFYDVQAGAITFDGQDIRHFSQSSVRRAIGIVPQDTVLFNDSIAYNIAYGQPGATQAEIERVASAAQIHDFIASTPKGYDTPVGERGLKLSGGEKQRVAIARTLLKNPHVLVFDEATSALDSANERAIQGQLLAAAQGKTTLLIAHRLSTVVHAHEIVVLDQGQVVERGNHSALLAMQGVYARMWHLQQAAGEAAASEPPLQGE